MSEYPCNDNRSRVWNSSMCFVTSYFNRRSLHIHKEQHIKLEAT